MIAVIILSNRAGAPGVNDRSSTRDGSGLRTPSVRLTLIWISFVEELFGGDETVGTITLQGRDTGALSNSAHRVGMVHLKTGGARPSNLGNIASHVRL